MLIETGILKSRPGNIKRLNFPLKFQHPLHIKRCHHSTIHQDLKTTQNRPLWKVGK